MLRLFAGLAIDEPTTQRLCALQPGLPGQPIAARNLHLTLAFFGDTPEPQAGDLHAALSAIGAPSFGLWLDGVGAFGGAKPRNLHALARPDPALQNLRDKIVRAARTAGVEPDPARFTPHVTLSRLRAGQASAAQTAAALGARAAFLAGPMAVEAFHLFRSDLSRHGAQYSALATYPLTPPGA